MRKTRVELNNGKSITVYESSAVEPSVWIELAYKNLGQTYALCNVEAAREIVAALSTFIEENS